MSPILVKTDLQAELKSIVSNSRHFLQFFGVFWGAILLFIVQNAGDPKSIASVIGAYSADVFSASIVDPNANILAYVSFALGILYPIMTLIFLSANTTVTKPSDYLRTDAQKYVVQRREILIKSVAIGIIGTIFLFLFCIIALMYSSERLSAQAKNLGQIFFVIIFILMFIVDPILVFRRRPKDKCILISLAWANLIIALFIGVTFILSKLLMLSQLLLIIFLWVFIIYFLLRVIASFFLPFVLTEAFSALIPVFPKQEPDKEPKTNKKGNRRS